MFHELIVSKGSQGSRGCCRAMTADCRACSAGITVAEFCKSHPQVVGCKGIKICNDIHRHVGNT